MPAHRPPHPPAATKPARRRPAGSGARQRELTPFMPSGNQSARLPPTPSPQAAPPGLGKTRRAKGRAIAFGNAGSRRHAEKPVDFGICYLPHPDSTKANAALATFQLPRNGRFLPRVDLFYPRVLFSASVVVSLSFSSSSEERERERGEQQAKTTSTSPKAVTKLYPRVSLLIHGNSVDEKRGNSKWRRALSCDRTLFHASTGCFPWGTAEGGADVR